MFEIKKQELMWGGRLLTLETGKIARQADGAVVVTYGDTTVLCTVVGAKKAKADAGFFPLTVHYQEKAFAAGKIPGGFFKREGKPSEYEVLTSRLIDRPIRPLFPDNFYNEVQIVATLLSYDSESDSDIAAIIGSSAALAISGIPFHAPVAAARVGYENGEFILNPTVKGSDLDLVVAGTSDGVLMVESEAKELSEDIMLGAVTFGHAQFQPVIAAIGALASGAGKAPWVLETAADTQTLYQTLETRFGADLRAAYGEKAKAARHEKLAALKDLVATDMVDGEGSNVLALRVFDELEKNTVRNAILKTGMRIDGRDTKTIRPILSEVGFLPRTHGSALFTRGETQAIVVTTLGTAQDEQIIDALSGESRERFMLHYNFPSYSVGEVGRMSSPGRREIGHGKLAWRALRPLMPTKEQFPYTVRTVSEITESNGSSSMATVCGASLSMMDAGVPLPRPIAGIAMGLIKEGKEYAVLSDILGDEDHLGDMDFKVAGTENGITALQMDIKITSITPEIMAVALKQANTGRLHILGEMEKALTESRNDVRGSAPRIVTLQIAKDKIRDLIGPGGKVIREICETTTARIDIEEDGTVTISAVGQDAIDAAIRRVQAVAADPEIGAIYDGVVVKLMEFGAFVSYFGERQGLVHISQIAHERIKKVEDVLKVGDNVKVKFTGYDDRGKAKLSMKELLPLPESTESA